MFVAILPRTCQRCNRIKILVINMTVLVLLHQRLCTVKFRKEGNRNLEKAQAGVRRFCTGHSREAEMFL